MGIFTIMYLAVLISTLIFTINGAPVIQNGDNEASVSVQDNVVRSKRSPSDINIGSIDSWSGGTISQMGGSRDTYNGPVNNNPTTYNDNSHSNNCNSNSNNSNCRSNSNGNGNGNSKSNSYTNSNGNTSTNED